MELTETQYDKLLHATANGEGWRYRYTVGDCESIRAEWESMEAAGLAKRYLLAQELGGLTYLVTHRGLIAAREEYTRRQAERGLRRYAVRYVEDTEGERAHCVWARSHSAARVAVAMDSERPLVECLRALRVRLAPWSAMEPAEAGEEVT